MISNAVAETPSIAPSIFAHEITFAPVAHEPALPSGVSVPAPIRYDSRIAEKVREREWKLGILAPALSFPKRSKARGGVLRSLAAQTHYDLAGQPVRIPMRTLSRWLGKADSDDFSTLARKQRSDRKERRCLISRTWDNSCRLPREDKEKIASELEIYIRSLWVNGAPGVNRIANFASSKLLRLCLEAGWTDANLNNCSVGRHQVEHHRDYGMVAIKERDAKRFADHFTPRIKRNRDDLQPMDVVIGDVHPLDVVKLHDGREVYPRLIAWLDLATYDIHVTIVILEKGKGIRKFNVADQRRDIPPPFTVPKLI